MKSNNCQIAWEAPFYLKNIDEITHVRQFKGQPPAPTAQTEERKSIETFHQLIQIFLSIGQCFAVMPLNGIRKKSAIHLEFRLFDYYMFYTLLVISASLSMAVINFYWLVSTTIKFDNIGPVLWYTSNTFIMFEFLRIGRKWPNLIQHWEQIEMETSIPNKKCHRKFKKLIYSASVGIPFLALLEHLLSIANGVNTGQQCFATKNLLEAYFRQAHPAYYSIFPYNMASGIVLQFLGLYCTFIWNFTDNFIIIISLGLTAQFQQFNKSFRLHQGKPFPDEFWGKQRNYYNRLTNLLKEVDEVIAIVILVSFSSNLYYICLQLFHSVTPSNSVVRSIYFWFSLFFLIGRTILVSLSAARINDESKKPILVLRTIPTCVYKIEAKRFLEQVNNNVTALSGLNFFHITRKFMLSVAGTVITYELVLIQLQREPDTSVDPCTR